VFSFLQKQTYPEKDSFLTPCIGVGGSSMFVVFYDAEKDILLQSSELPLFESEGSGRFNVETVLVAWLTVNYNFLCSGVTTEMQTLKADFFSQAKDKLEIYNSQLKFSNVRNSAGESVEPRGDFVPSQFLLERQERINSIQQRIFLSKLEERS
jgi:hypothetical protein